MTVGDEPQQRRDGGRLAARWRALAPLAADPDQGPDHGPGPVIGRPDPLHALECLRVAARVDVGRGEIIQGRGLVGALRDGLGHLQGPCVLPPPGQVTGDQRQMESAGMAIAFLFLPKKRENVLAFSSSLWGREVIHRRGRNNYR